MEDAGWGPGVAMTPGRYTPGRSPYLRASPSQLASPAGQSPFNDAIMFSPMGAGGDGIMFSPGPATSPGYRCCCWGRGGRWCGGLQVL